MERMERRGARVRNVLLLIGLVTIVVRADILVGTAPRLVETAAVLPRMTGRVTTAVRPVILVGTAMRPRPKEVRAPTVFHVNPARTANPLPRAHNYSSVTYHGKL